MTLLIIYALISIGVSFLCSVLEAVFLSVTPTFINVKKQENKAYAFLLENLKKDVDKPLIAILTLNTIAHTVGAIMVGSQAEKLPFKVDFFGINIVGIVSALMTFLILVVSEIIPKTIGATYWKKLANFTSKALTFMIWPLKYTGILWLLQLTTKLIGGKHAHGSVFNREDFTAMADIAQEEGVFQESESNFIKNLVRFNEIQAKDIMTPRTVIKTASADQTIEAFFKENPKLRFSRIPIYQEKMDNITGFVLKDQVLEEMINGNGHNPLSTLNREILVTKRSIPLPKLFEKFIQNRDHIALVVDEYGSISGLVTMEDIIETLLGLEIVDESDNVEDLQLLARRNWQLRAERMGILEITDEEQKNEESKD
ncbi:CNNM domain-containing protein [Robertkochia solimangrovi]|uniref:CNNM domain-containing protein n=1 Tax=Robertkochia solimangrovi TaxID=2213046 RepID=UPI00117D936E|nr:hemolysin family protein [Robertkochia solimangrovi]TRZ45959.1 hemolysin [Robertkochia solimangrovi]